MPRIETQSAGGRCRGRFLKLREYGFKFASLMGPGITLGIELDPIGAERRNTLYLRRIRVHKEAHAAPE